MKKFSSLFTLLTILSVFFVGCAATADSEVNISDPTAPPAPAASDEAQNDPVMLKPGDSPRPPAGILDTSKTYTAKFETEAGNFEVLLYDDEAPLTVENFVNLATIGFYDNTTFHRVIPGFMAQGGDPQGTGAGGPGYQFSDEFNAARRHAKPGMLSMANAGPGTNGSQFFITFGPTPHLDDKHTVFGEVVKGYENVLKIRERDPGTDQKPGDLIKSIAISVR